MSQALQAIRGMNDVLPDELLYWQHIESVFRDLMASYSYREIRFPIVENTLLFKRSVGEVTDIVEKEMYTFDDRNGDSLSLRPEGTAGCVRAAIEHGLLFNQIQRLWYLGPMFRHERPQKGRYRQFYQLGVEAFGMNGPDIDVEVILLSQRIFASLDLLDHVELQMNSLGTSESRARYCDALVTYLKKHVALLDEDSQRRLDKNPLRILDSKNSVVKQLVMDGPKLADYLDEESRTHFEKCCRMLDECGVKYTLNPTLVRGLDYYGLTVFEWVTDSLGAQGTVCAGGRYDTLVELLGGKPTPAIGFALGIERLVLMLQAQKALEVSSDVIFVLSGEAAQTMGLKWAERLRTDLPFLKVECNLSAGGFKSQFKRADKSGARFAVIIADDEVASDNVTLKDLRGEAEQQKLSYQALKELLMRNNYE